MESPEIGQIEHAYAEKRKRQFEYESISERRRQDFLSRIGELMEERRAAMLKASAHAGAIGLIYHAKSNSFSRVIVPDEIARPTIDRPMLQPEITNAAQIESLEAEDTEKVAPPERRLFMADPSVPETSKEPGDQDTQPEAQVQIPILPKHPEPPLYSPPQTVLTATEPDISWKKSVQYKSALAWIFAILVGLFVGFGLLTLTGLPHERPEDRINLIAALVIGSASIGSFKLLFDQLWHVVGRESVLGNRLVTTTLIASFFSLVLVAAEVALGATALVKYSEASSFRGEGQMPMWQAALVAIAISAANVLFSAVVGYQKGRHSVSESDIQKAHADQVQSAERARHELEVIKYQREVELWQKEVDRREELLSIQHADSSAKLERGQQRLRRESELEEARHRIQLLSIEDSVKAHEEAVDTWKRKLEEVSITHGEAKIEQVARQESYERFYRLPDFQALCTYIGTIEALTFRIEELKRLADNDSISRGHTRKHVI